MATKLEIGGIVTLGIAIITGAVWIGELRSDVNSLEKRVRELENRVDPLRQLKVGKGDLCLKMLDQLGSVPDRKRQQQLRQQWDRSGCESLPAKAIVNVSDAVAAERSTQNATENAN